MAIPYPAHPPLGHEMIMASAGSGKTHTLTNRYLKLLALGEAPETIIALTFSRASGAEFFQKILGRLSKAALTDDGAVEMAGQLAMPGLQRDDFVTLLSTLTKNWHRLPLGTMDSFFARIAQTFPFELGLQGGYQMLDKFTQKSARREVYRRMFQAQPEPTKEQQEFIAAFQQSTHGREERTLVNKLDYFVEKYAKLIVQCPDTQLWGNPGRIWSSLPDFWKVTGTVREALQALAALEITETGLAREITKLCELWADYQVGGSQPKTNTFITRLFEEGQHIVAGATVRIKIGRAEQELPFLVAQPLRDFLLRLQRDEWVVRVVRTQGMAKILKQFDAQYHEQIRAAGFLTFEDVQRLVSCEFLPPEVDGAEASALAAEEVYFRLDGKLNHWLLDEFQDTSRLQWKVLEPLITEVLQADDVPRSFFAVGDVKQAIYGWRGGESQLFSYLQTAYPEAEGHGIHIAELNKSWRSSPAVLKLPNTLFGDAAALQNLLPNRELGSWKFSNHATQHQELSGCSEVYAVAKPSGKEEPGSKWAADWLVMKAKLAEINPLARGLSCAVFLVSNEKCNLMAEFIQSELGMKAVTKSKISIAMDNTVTVALLALLQAAAHPGDTLAGEHVRMKVLHETLVHRYGLKKPEYLGRRVLQDIALLGFAETLSHWLAWLDTSHTRLDDFSRHRWLQLIGIAREYESRYASKDVDDFIAFAESRELGVPGSEGAVQVRTWASSKGLEYDVVFVLGLEHPTHASQHITNEMAVYSAPGSSEAVTQAQWLSFLPNKDIASMNPVYDQWNAQFVKQRWEENLSKLYVVLTRAKRHSCVIFPTIKETKEGEESRLNYQRLLTQLLDDGKAPEETIDDIPARRIFAAGDPHWYEAVPLQQPKPTPPEAKTAELFQEHWTHTLPQETNAVSQPSEPAAQAFRVKFGFFRQGGNSTAAELGTLVHELLRQVQWLNRGFRVDSLALPPEAPESLANLARMLVREFLARESIRPYFDASEHPPGTEIWREKAFQVALGGKLIRGVFDRVLLHRHPATQAIEQAILVDFKLADAKGQSEQLTQYQAALSQMLDLPPAAVEIAILEVQKSSAR